MITGAGGRPGCNALPQRKNDPMMLPCGQQKERSLFGRIAALTGRQDLSSRLLER